MSTDLAVLETQVATQLTDVAFLGKLEAALPEGISPDKFARVTITALMEDAVRQPDQGKRLIGANRDSLFLALVKSAQDGLMPDGRQAALVRRGDAVVYQPMVQGLRYIAAQYGWTITAHVVCANDFFEFTVEPENIHHKPVGPGQARGEFVACYATARHRDGRRVQRVLYRDEVMKRKAMATTKQVWDKWEEQQWEKTVARDVFAELPLEAAQREQLLRVLDATIDADPAEALYGPRGETLVARELPPDGESAGAEGAQSVLGAPAVEPGEPFVAPPGETASFAEFEEETPAADPNLEAAQAAAAHVVKVPASSSWVNGMTLAAVNADERAEVFFRYALSAKLRGGDLKAAVAAYVRVKRPELYAELVQQ